MTVLVLSVALMRSGLVRRWLGYAALAPGIWLGVGGVWFVLVGPLAAGTAIGYVVPGFVLANVWVFLAAFAVWRLDDSTGDAGDSRLGRAPTGGARAGA
jgi:hypothetical protein